MSHDAIFQNGLELAEPLFAQVGGIDLGDDGPAPNHASNPIAGPNHSQNYPVISSVISSAGSTVVNGMLRSASNATYTIEFFSNPAADSSGYDQGQAFLAAIAVTTDSTGTALLTAANAALPVAIAAGTYVTATATDPQGDTSEFSRALPVLQLAVNPSATTANFGDSVTYTFTVTNAGGSRQVGADGTAVSVELSGEVARGRHPVAPLLGREPGNDLLGAAPLSRTNRPLRRRRHRGVPVERFPSRKCRGRQIGREERMTVLHQGPAAPN
jgi:hypothetical protein